jgi:hypothetical protein
MYKILNKHGQSLALGLGVLVIAIFMITVLSGLSSAGYDMGTDLNGLGDEAKDAINFFNPTLRITLALVVIGALAWALFGIYHLVSAPKNSLKFIVGFGVVIVLFIIFYTISQPETTGDIYRLVQKNGISETVSKFISAGVKTSLVLLLLAAAFMVVSEIRNFFK